MNTTLSILKPGRFFLPLLLFLLFCTEVFPNSVISHAATRTSCNCDDPALVTTYNKVLAFGLPPHPDSCYYTLDLTSNSGCTISSAKIMDEPSGNVLVPVTAFNDGSITPFSGPHTNVLRLPDHIALAKFNGKKIIRTVFYNSIGDELCSQLDTLESCDCCKKENYQLTYTLQEVFPAWMCCWNIRFSSTYNACDVKSIKMLSTTGSVILAKTDFAGGPVNAGETRYNAVSLCMSKFSGAKAVDIVLYDINGNALCQFRDTLTGCGCVQNACANPSAIDIRLEKYSNGGQCCWKVYAKNNGSCDMVFDIGVGIRIDQQMASITSGDWTASFSPGNFARWYNGSGENKILTGQEIYLGDFCLNENAGNVKVWKFIDNDCDDEELTDIRCHCTDSACSYPERLNIRMVPFSSGTSCCWKVYAKNNGACDLRFDRGVGVRFDKQVSYIGPGDWVPLGTPGNFAQWYNASAGESIIAAGEEVYLGDFCVNQNTGRVKVWKMVDNDCASEPMADIGCNCIDTVCSHPDEVNIRMVKYNDGANCCWKVYAKNTGPCDLEFTRGVGISADHQLLSITAGDWTPLVSPGNFAQWYDASGPRTIIHAGEEVYLGDICVSASAGRVKIWKLLDNGCGEEPIADIGCNCTDDACDSAYTGKLKPRFVKVSGNGQECCFDLYITNTDACALNLHKGIMLHKLSSSTQVTGFSNGEWVGVDRGAAGIWWRQKNTFNSFLQSGKELFVGRICVENNSSLPGMPFEIRLLGDNFPADPEAYCSAPLFNSSITCDSPVTSCCTGLFAMLQRPPVSPFPDPNCACKFNVRVSGFDPACTVYGIRLVNTGDGNLSQLISLPAPVDFSNGPFNMGVLCIPATVSGAYTYRAKIVVQFLDSAGNVICNTILEDSCVQSGAGTGIIPQPVTALADQANGKAGTFTAYPNPFSDRITIRYSWPADADTRIEIYDMNGKLTSVLHDKYQASGGEKELQYDAAHLARGIYLIRLFSEYGASVIQVVK
jgi:phage tail protein X